MALLHACEAAVTVEMVEANGCNCTLDDLAIDIEDLIDAASDTLYTLSGGAVSGRCEQTYRPCGVGNCWCGRPAYCCACEVPGIPLPGADPTVTEVKIDGEVVTGWAIIDDYKLVRTGGAYWPTGKNPLLPDTEDNTFSLTVEFGAPWNFVAQMAAIELVCEMARVLGGAEGQLPPGTVSATKDGVTIVVERLPGQADLEAVGLTWLSRFLNIHGVLATASGTSPELREGWKLMTVEFGP